MVARVEPEAKALDQFSGTPKGRAGMDPSTGRSRRSRIRESEAGCPSRAGEELYARPTWISRRKTGCGPDKTPPGQQDFPELRDYGDKLAGWSKAQGIKQLYSGD
jgi:hypothetical protein